jgi:hypothetical protein
MKTAMRALIALAFLATPLAASAQEAPADDVKTKFYNFEDMLIDGQYKKPQVLYTDARQKVNFERLLKLKKEFLPKLKATAKDASLR